ncbi:uncharacterized protein LOC144755804 [Lissotriton helveticus]
MAIPNDTVYNEENERVAIPEDTYKRKLFTDKLTFVNRYLRVSHLPPYFSDFSLILSRALLVYPPFASDCLADLLASKFLLTRDNHTNLVIRIIPGTVGFMYLTFTEGDTVPIAYRSHLYTSAELQFSTVEKVLTAVQMAILKERTLSQGKRMLVVTPCPALEAVTKASVPNSKALHPRWIQWAASLTSQDVTFIFDATLRSQEYLQYEFGHPPPLAMRPLEDFHCIIYTDGSAQVAHGSKHAYVSACTIVVGAMVNDEFQSRVVHTQTLGDCTAQLAELRALLLSLEYTDPSVTTLIVSDSYYCVQSYNVNLFFWIQNDFRDSKGSTIKHKMIWVRVAELKERLPIVFVVHTLGHQRVGVHAVGNSLADEAAKSAVSTYLVAAVTRSKSKIDDDILAAVAATEKGGKYPTGFPSKYTYHLSPDKVPFVKIPEVGERLIPNSDRRASLITAAHEGVASAHAGVSATLLMTKTKTQHLTNNRLTRYEQVILATENVTIKRCSVLNPATLMPLKIVRTTIVLM